MGGVFVGSAFWAPFYGYPYPYYASPYAYPYPAYAAPLYMPPPSYQSQLYLSPPPQREVCYVGGCYHLEGDGISVAYRWVWVPTVPPASVPVASRVKVFVTGSNTSINPLPWPCSSSIPPSFFAKLT